MDDDLCTRPATELAALARDRAVSARELMDAHLDRISPSPATVRGPPYPAAQPPLSDFGRELLRVASPALRRTAIHPLPLDVAGLRERQ